MERRSLVNTIPTDLSGGLTAAILMLPESIAFGCLIVAPLGPKLIPMGIVMGLISVAVMNLATAPFGRRNIMLSSPFSLASLMLSTVIATIIQKHHLSPENNAALILSLLFFISFLAGLLQVSFGLLKLGQLAKYIPFPVISGLFNGTAILIIMGQLNIILGIHEPKLLLNISEIIYLIKPYTLLIALITIIVIWLGKNYKTAIPAPILGLLAGTIAYYVIKYIMEIQFFGFTGTGQGKDWTLIVSDLGPVVGSIPADIPSMGIGQSAKAFLTFFLSLFSSAGNANIKIILDLLPLTFGIALILSLKSLISLISLDNLIDERSNSNHALIGQGIGNMLASIFGGVAAAGNVSSTVANFEYGGRTFFSKVIAAIFIIGVLILLHPLVSLMPKVVLAAILVYLAFAIFDPWIFKLIRQFFKAKGAQKRDSLINIILILIVTLAMVMIGIFEAVGVGIMAAILMFVVRMGKDVIRRQFTGEKLRSNVERPENEVRLLEKEGARIRILELEGSLFFGTADRVSEIVTSLISGKVEYIILDFKRINDIDSTGTHILNQLSRRCALYKTFLLFSSLEERIIGYSLTEMKKNIHENLEDALAWSEDNIIERFMKKEEYEREIALNEIDALLHLTDDEMEILLGFLNKIDYEKDSLVFKEGDSGDKIYFIVRGRAHVFINLNKDENRKRISTLSKGTIFGEMALIDRKPRSAAVIADEKLICYTLERTQLTELAHDYPKVAYKVIVGVTRELSKRIRIINNMITQLKN